MRNTNKILAALGIGIAAGAIAGVLFAPRKGTETRELIAKKGTKLSNDIKDGFQEGQKKLSALKDGLNHLNKKVEEVM
jgi:gas vesicle protein